MNDSQSVKTIQVDDFPLWEKTRRKRTLLSLSIELTARCNNNCSHCYINLPCNDTNAIKKELTLSEIKKLIDEAIELGCLWIDLTGGEPMLRDDFKDIYMYCKKKGLLISVFTNASLISKDIIRLFKQYPPDNIEITVYGVTPATHKKVTRNNLFRQTQEGIQGLIDASVPVNLKTTILRSNFEQFDEIAAFCHKKSKLPFRFDPFLHLRFDRDKERNAQIREQRLTSDEIIKLEKNDTIRFEELKKACTTIFSDIDNQTSHTLFRCGAGLNSCYISYDGTFKICSSLCHDKCTYDLRQANLTEAWKIFAPSVISKSSDRTSFKETCMTCHLSSLCLCCPAHADLEINELDGHIPYFCDMAQMRLKNVLK